VSAAQFLAQFRSQRFTPIAIDADRPGATFGELGRLGRIHGSGVSSRSERAARIGDAIQQVGFVPRVPDQSALPAGLETTPVVQVVPASEVRFTFDRAKAREYFDRTGHPDLVLPEKFDGASLVMQAPAAVLLEYRSTDNRRGLMVAQTRQLSMGAEGNATLDELRDFMLSLPSMPPETARQLRAIPDWRDALPIPIPADRVNWRDVTIGGGPGLLLTDSMGLGSAAIWQRGDRVFGIFGSVATDDPERVANSLR
jgi:hypothetical protein